MEVDIYQARTDLYFAIEGRIVLEECERLKELSLPLINRGTDQVIVDLSKVSFIDSAGLGVLVGMKMTSSKNGARIVLLQPSRPVSDILFISKLDGIFDIMTGAEADLLKSQLVQPHFRIGGTEEETKRPDPAATADGKHSKLDTAFPHRSPSSTGGEPSELRGQKEQIEAYCRRAVEFMRQGNYELSVQEYQKALSVDPDYLPALNNLAIVYEKQPSWSAKAIEQWEHVLRLSQQRSDQKHIDRAQRHLANLRRLSA
jgi:anti-sigma B factor antagonist